MKLFEVCHFGGTVLISGKDLLERVYLHRYGSFRSNHFVISPEGSPLPCLTVFVRSDIAVVHYFDNNGGCLISLGSKLDASDEYVIFEDCPDGSTIYLASENVIEELQAREAVTQFVSDTSLPSSFEWMSL
jgi:hypothetical protein